MHRSRDCNASISCNECGSKHHTTALHTNRAYQSKGAPPSPPTSVDGGEQLELAETKLTSVSSTCTYIYKDGNSSKSCAKILVNVFYKNNQDKVNRIDAIIDDQSNRSLAAPEFFNTRFNLLQLIECDSIPIYQNEIATPEDILQYQHLQEQQKNILSID